MKTSKIKNFSLIPTSWYYLPKIPITAVIIKQVDQKVIDIIRGNYKNLLKTQRGIVEDTGKKLTLNLD